MSKYMEKLFLCVLLLNNTSIFAKESCEVKRKKIIVANKTDLKEEIKNNAKKGWKPEGKAYFKSYGYYQTFVKKICK